MFELLYLTVLSLIGFGVLLAPLWLAGAIGLYLKWPLAHLLPITAVLWIIISVTAALNSWHLNRGG